MKFEDLIAWKESRGLVNAIYELFRLAELSRDFGLRDQLQRASVSIMTNLAEGFERTGKGEKLQFYNIARASCGEVRSLLYVVQDNYPKSKSVASQLQNNAQIIGKLITGLIRSTKS